MTSIDIGAALIAQFERDSLAERGRVLTGEWGHWCDDWDGLTMDETCHEFPCACYRYELHWVDQGLGIPGDPHI